MKLSRCLALALCALVLPETALAGPWKRPADQGFASTSLTFRKTDNQYETELGYYRDFAVSPLFDLGVDLNQVDLQSGHALVFVRVPLRKHPHKFRAAAEIALGASFSDPDWSHMYRFTLSAGRNFEMRSGALWSSVDLTYEQRGSDADPLWKLDSTVGWRGRQRISPLLQIETTFGSNRDFTYSLIPAVRIKLDGLNLPLQKHLEDSEVVIGLEYRKAAEHSLGLRIALWQRF